MTGVPEEAAVGHAGALPLAGCTFGWLHQAPLTDALRSLSAHGVRAIELTTAPPHLFTRHFGRYERRDLACLLRRLGLRVLSVNPAMPTSTC